MSKNKNQVEALTIHSFKEPVKFNKEQALNFVDFAKSTFLLNDDVASYLTGFHWGIKKGKLDFIPNPDARNPKDGFMPRLRGLELFPSMMPKLEVFAPTIIESKNKKDEAKLFGDVEPIYAHQHLLTKNWREVDIDYFMASNDVIYKEMLRDFATFIAYFEVFRKFAIKKAKADPRVLEFYLDVFKEFHEFTWEYDENNKQVFDEKVYGANGKKIKPEEYAPRIDWWKFIFEDILTLGAGFKSKHSKVPVDLTEWRVYFWTVVKEESKKARSVIK
jgi:hypothetical protein